MKDRRRFRECLAMPFSRLVDLVFFPDGEPKLSIPEARMALILRLTDFTGHGGFGDPDTGELNELEAWLTAQYIFNKMEEGVYPCTTRHPSF